MKIVINGKEAAGAGGADMEVYSTEETRIGTWIDGKPLYRKVYIETTGTAGAFTRIEGSNLLDIDTCVSIQAVVQGSAATNNTKAPIAFISGQNFYVAFGSAGYLVSYTETAHYSGMPFTAIIEYTKTTDEGS